MPAAGSSTGPASKTGRKRERSSLSAADYAGLITAAHQQLHAPVILCWDYVPRNIIPVVCPVVLCGQRQLAVLVTGGERLRVPLPVT